jgi:hypothetical protein
MTDVVRIQIPELAVAGKPLGRHIHIDSRSAQYPAETASQIVSVMHASTGLPLTQTRGSCTAESVCGALNSAPHYGTGARGQAPLTQPDADALYNAESILQGTGPVPPNDPGGSGTEVCQAAKNAGMLRGYQHAVGIDAALGALVIRPVITGVNWFTSFDTPDEHGLVQIAKRATVRGGHEFVAVAIDAVSELVWFPNSWGLGFGVALPDIAGAAYGTIPGGCFCMRFDTWSTLLTQGGDVTVPLTAHGWHT